MVIIQFFILVMGLLLVGYLSFYLLYESAQPRYHIVISYYYYTSHFIIEEQLKAWKIKSYGIPTIQDGWRRKGIEILEDPSYFPRFASQVTLALGEKHSDIIFDSVLIRYNLTPWQRLQLPGLFLMWYFHADKSKRKESWHLVKKGMEKHEHRFKVPFTERYKGKEYTFMQCEHEGCNECEENILPF